MTSKTLRRATGLLITTAFMFSLFGMVGVVSAEEGGQNTSSTSSSEKRQEISQKQAETKKKMCERRSQVIGKVMSHMGERTQKQIEKIDAINKHVQGFYAKKGKTVSNYDALVAEVNAKQAAAKTAAEHMSQEKQMFSCSKDNPQGIIQEFRTAHHALIEAMKAYKTAVKNLIVAVKTAQGGAQ